MGLNMLALEAFVRKLMPVKQMAASIKIHNGRRSSFFLGKKSINQEK